MNVRRQLLLAIGAAALMHSNAPRALDAAKRPRIGYVQGAGLQTGVPGGYLATFRDELGRLGYVDGNNLVIDVRAGEGDIKRIPGIVQELVQSKVDVLVSTNLIAVQAAQRATTTIPIVAALSVDPVVAGFAKNFRRPGGNFTGIYTLRADLGAKRIELLHELIPGLSRVAILWDVDAPSPKQRFQDYVAAAKTKKLEVVSLEVKADAADFEKLMRTAVSSRAQALIVITNPYIGSVYKRVLTLAAGHKLPTMGETRAYPNAGGLISYADDLDEQAKVLASIVARVLKGAKPADLPIEQPTKFELVINLKTAKALGLKIPSEIMVRADRIIQ